MTGSSAERRTTPRMVQVSRLLTTWSAFSGPRGQFRDLVELQEVLELGDDVDVHDHLGRLVR